MRSTWLAIIWLVKQSRFSFFSILKHVRYRRKKFTFAISSPDEFLYFSVTSVIVWDVVQWNSCLNWLQWCEKVHVVALSWRVELQLNGFAKYPQQTLTRCCLHCCTMRPSSLGLFTALYSVLQGLTLTHNEAKFAQSVHSFVLCRKKIEFYDLNY